MGSGKKTKSSGQFSLWQGMRVVKKYSTTCIGYSYTTTVVRNERSDAVSSNFCLEEKLNV